MSEEPKDLSKPIPVSEKEDPCGCYHTTYSNDKIGIQPCFGHGLIQVGIGLGHAANALDGLGRRAVAEAQQDAMNAIAERLQAQKNGGKIIRP